jgi:FlaA1/EpsC-like NDP-sugar epimerase
MNDSKLWAWLDKVMSAPGRWPRVGAQVADALIVLACWHVTYLFRLGFERWQPGRPWYDDAVSLAVVGVYLLCLWLTGAHRGLWRFVGFDDIKRIAVACVIAGLLSAVGVLMAHLSGVARAVLLLHPLFAMIALSMARMVYRVIWEHALSRVTGVDGETRRALVLGAGEAARRLIAGIHRRDGWIVLGLLDDDPAKQGIRVSGIPVLGTLNQLLKTHVLSGATHVILAMPDAPGPERERAMTLARETGLVVLTVPGQSELQP